MSSDKEEYKTFFYTDNSGNEHYLKPNFRTGKEDDIILDHTYRGNFLHQMWHHANFALRLMMKCSKYVKDDDRPADFTLQDLESLGKGLIDKLSKSETCKKELVDQDFSTDYRRAVSHSIDILSDCGLLTQKREWRDGINQTVYKFT